MLQLMKRINRIPDFSIYVTNPLHAGSKLLEHRLATYEATFAPYASANIAIRLDTSGA